MNAAVKTQRTPIGGWSVHVRKDGERVYFGYFGWFLPAIAVHGYWAVRLRLGWI